MSPHTAITRMGETEMTSALKAPFQRHAEAEGWAAVACDPSSERGNDDPTLFHAVQNRVWPAGDWAGALADLGFGADEMQSA